MIVISLGTREGWEATFPLPPIRTKKKYFEKSQGSFVVKITRNCNKSFRKAEKRSLPKLCRVQDNVQKISGYLGNPSHRQTCVIYWPPTGTCAVLALWGAILGAFRWQWVAARRESGSRVVSPSSSVKVCLRIGLKRTAFTLYDKPENNNNKYCIRTYQ